MRRTLIDLTKVEMIDIIENSGDITLVFHRISGNKIAISYDNKKEALDIYLKYRTNAAIRVENNEDI